MPEKKYVSGKDEKRIRKDERRKVRRKKRAKGTLLGTLIILLLFLLFMGGSNYFGVNPFGGGNDGDGTTTRTSSSQNEEGETDEATEAISTSEEKSDSQMSKQEIIVEGDRYIYLDEEYDISGIEGVIDGLELDGRNLKLIDKVANSKAFDDIEKILQDKGVEYNTQEQYE